MIGPVAFPHEVVSSTMTQGAPGLVRAAGRAFGLGQAEQNALAAGQVPWWFWAVFGVGAGLIVGVQVQKRWPRYASYVGGG
jgi:hypothetical protein